MPLRKLCIFSVNVFWFRRKKGAVIFLTPLSKTSDKNLSKEKVNLLTSGSVDSVSIDNEFDYENEILPMTMMRMRFAQNTCSTRSGNSFHDEISYKTQSAMNEFLKGKVYLLKRVISAIAVSHKHLNSSSKAYYGIFGHFLVLNSTLMLFPFCQDRVKILNMVSV